MPSCISNSCSNLMKLILCSDYSTIGKFLSIYNFRPAWRSRKTESATFTIHLNCISTSKLYKQFKCYKHKSKPV